MRLPRGTGGVYQALKWFTLAVAMGLVTANISTILWAIFFIFISAEWLAFTLSFAVWLAATGALLWLVSRGGRRERRAGRERSHTAPAKERAAPHAIRDDYDILDIGLKPWISSRQIFRDEALPDDIPGFFPTVRLWMRRSYAGRLHFDFYDDHGDLMPGLSRSKRVLLLTGHRNIIIRHEVELDTPALPTGIWEMEVRLDDTPLAVHRFGWFPVGEDPEPEEDFVYPHAQAAVTRANAAVNDIHPTLTDIGLLVVKSGEREATIYRTEALPRETIAARPFIRLNLPQRATGEVRFLIIDRHGVIRYDHREDHDYEAGDNIIAARTRLPLDDPAALTTGWRLDVFVGETLVARHAFDWATNIPDILDPLEKDGEITSRLRQRLADADEQLSLRDLLSEQRTRHRR